ncbi:M12 family metallopeptidase [Kitasatospora sp. NPDC057015]|uniref:M12 family metallopeptidase n=1 Tax=Kitasatospora sp. NPDC057015 TaxID=3346001 RepID=UPI0036356DD6
MRATSPAGRAAILALLVGFSAAWSVAAPLAPGAAAVAKGCAVGPTGGGARSAGARPEVSAGLWPGGVVPYRIDPAAKSLGKVLHRAMHEIESNSCVRFVRAEQQRDWIHFVRGEGCYSYVGVIGGRQNFSLGEGCDWHGTVLHELMHALGFFHEHMRGDRDRYLVLHLENVEPSLVAQFGKVATENEATLGPFDYDSIMIYGSKSFSSHGRPTMSRPDGGPLVDPYARAGLSRGDIGKLHRRYPPA